MTPESGNPTQDLRTILRVFWRWKALFLVLLLAPPVVAYLLVRNNAKQYQSSALVALSQNASVAAGVPQQNIQAVAQIIETTSFRNVAATLMKRGEALGGVSAVADSSTGFITITSTGNSPAAAADTANAYAQALAKHQRDVTVQSIAQQIKVIQGQLSALGKNDPTRAQLHQQLVQLQGQQAGTGPGASILQPAAPNSTPIGPHTRRDVEIGLVIGLLLAVGAVFLAENSDRRLRQSDDLENSMGLPVLSAIPKSAFSTHPEAAEHAAEAFQMLRTALTYFNVDRRLASVAIVSAEGEDGKTTVAVGVATAAAKAGRHVILLEADLRLPQIAQRFGLDYTLPGLGAVLAGERSLVDVLVDIPVEADHAGRLQILPAGPPPPNPTALVSSDQMRQLIGRLESLSELVIVDTPAALAVSDALPLVQWVSGAVVVVRLNRTARSALRRLQKMIVAGHGTILGAVATGSGAGDTYGYRYGYDRYSDARTGPKKYILFGKRRPRAPKGTTPQAAPAAAELNNSHDVESTAHMQSADVG